jgi:hypothetical protein
MEETDAMIAKTLLRRNTQVGFAINVSFQQHAILTY